MSVITIYGIKNCDTMKKAFKWFESANIDYTFHDYKKQGVDKEIFILALEQHGWENVINRRGTTWRKLSDDIKETMNTENAIRIALDNPSIIKRPLIVKADKVTLGFNEQGYEHLF